jgi:hypothetical protein
VVVRNRILFFIYARVEVKNEMAEEGKWGPSQALIEHKKITGTGSNIFDLFRTWKTFRRENGARV